MLYLVLNWTACAVQWRLSLNDLRCGCVVVTVRETMTVQPRLLSVAELSHHLAESYLTCSLYIQEMLQFKRQNHGKVGFQYRYIYPLSSLSKPQRLSQTKYEQADIQCIHIKWKCLDPYPCCLSLLSAVRGKRYRGTRNFHQIKQLDLVAHES